MNPKKIRFIDKSLEKALNILSENDPVKKAITKAIKEIKKNCYCGRNVKKKLIPKRLIEKYGINNLWIYNLPSAWRLLYSLTTSEEIELIAVILDWMNHKDYERLFRFN
jgi:Txe/YoeB family toxin of Txe-Axe toxin-antitoxin module